MGASTPQTPVQYNTGDEMDWTPAVAKPESEYRAFKPLPVGVNSTRFGQSPVEEHASAIWYRVPPAPITPAQRLRNPPNQPRFQATSQVVKENFFNTVARPNSGELKLANSQGNELPRHEMKLRQPTFFPPAPPEVEVGNALADLLTSVSLGTTDPEPPAVLAKQFQWDHFAQAVVLGSGLFFWNNSFANPGEHTMKVMLAVMTMCIAIGTRTIFKQLSSQPGKKSNVSKVFGMTLGVLECLSAFSGIVETLAGRGECTNCASLGTILLGGMLVQEFWYASFG